MVEVSRRDLLRLGGGLALLGAVGCAAPARAATAPTFADWVRTRRAPYLIAHRGAGTTVPEHSLPGYARAVSWRAPAMEISVVRSKDGVLYCHHDLRLERTTTLAGATAQTSSVTFDTGRILVPRLGPRWAGDNMPAIPRLEAALDLVAGRAVLLTEAKDDLAYEPMIAALTQRSLLDQIMVKASYDSSRIAQAKASGLPVFAYLGSASVATPANIDALAAKLDRDNDAIALPLRDEQGVLLDDALFRHAVASGVQTWAFPVHRRAEVAHLSALGVAGFVTPALGYLAGELLVAEQDSFEAGELAPGVTTKDPYSDVYALDWGVPDAVGLATEDVDGPRFVCLGDLCPVAGPEESYQVQLEVSLQPEGNTTPGDAFVVAFGCMDDSYAEAADSGYQAWLFRDGSLHLFVVGTDGGRVLAARGTHSTRLRTGEWDRVTITVSPDAVRVATDGGGTVASTDTTWRGGYLHVGRNQGLARFAVRSVSVTS